MKPTLAEKAAQALGGREVPSWFGILEKYARRVERHDMDAIRESIARGVAIEHGLLHKRMCTDPPNLG
jgi:hypothetical protein